MPRTFTEQITDFSGLLNSFDAPHEVEDNEAVIAQNVRATGKGKLQKRYGYDQVSSGGDSGSGVRGLLTFRRLIGERKYLLIANNANIYTITPDDTVWRDRGAYGTDSGERVNGAISTNIAVFGDGSSSNVVKKLDEVEEQENSAGANTDTIATSIAEGATERQTLTAVASGEDIISIEVSVNAKGTGDWTVTLHNIANTALASATLANDLLTNSAFNKFTLNTPVTSDGTVYHVHVTSTVADGSADSTVTNDLEGLHYKLNTLQVATLSGAPNGDIFASNRGFMYVSGATLAPTLVYWPDHETLTYTGGVSGNAAINLNDGEKVTALVPFISQGNDSLLVFKEFSKYFLEPVTKSAISSAGDADALEFIQSETSDRSGGTFAGNSAVQVGKQGVIFLGEDKFQSYGYVENFSSIRLPENLSEKIAPTVRNINKAQVHKSTGIHDEFNNVYRCSVPIGVNTKNSVEFVYDLKFSSWSVNTGLSVSDYEVFEDSAGDRAVYFGSEHSGKVFRTNKRFSDNYSDTSGTGEAVDAIWRSKSFRAGNSKVFEKNRFGGVIVKGAITNIFSGTFSIIVKNRLSSEQQDRVITQADILGVGELSPHVGDEYVGQGYVGSGGTAGDEPALFPFKVEIPFASNTREGDEVYFVFRNNNDQQGFRIESIVFTGEEKVSKPLTPAA